MNSGVLDLKMRRNVSLAPIEDAELVGGDFAAEAPIANGRSQPNSATAIISEVLEELGFIGLLDAGSTRLRFFDARG